MLSGRNSKDLKINFAATDADSGDNGKLNFTLRDDYHDLFRMISTDPVSIYDRGCIL